MNRLLHTILIVLILVLAACGTTHQLKLEDLSFGCGLELSQIEPFLDEDGMLVIRTEEKYTQFCHAIMQTKEGLPLADCKAPEVDFSKDAFAVVLGKVEGASDGDCIMAAKYFPESNKVELQFQPVIEKEGSTYVFLLKIFAIRNVPAETQEFSLLLGKPI